nr:hypothetical protein BaRGS_030880 [Batillaria attramentaria]
MVQSAVHYTMKKAAQVLAHHYSRVQHETTDNVLELSAFRTRCCEVLSSESEFDVVLKQLEIDKKVLLTKDKDGNLVVKAYESGLGAIRHLTGDLTVDKVDKVLDDLQEVLGEQEEVSHAVSSVTLPGLDVSQDDLEKELDSLLAEGGGMGDNSGLEDLMAGLAAVSVKDGISCKNKACDVIFKEKESKRGHSADAVKIVTGSTVQVFSVRLRDRGPDYRGFVQLPLVQDQDGNPASFADPAVLAQVSNEIKQAIWLLATETTGPLVQRVTKNIMVVKCKPNPKQPLGFLHFAFFETTRNRQQPDYKFQCSCKAFRMPLEITRSFVENRDGTFDLYEVPKVAVENIDETYKAKNQTPIRPFELKTFLKGNTTSDQKDPTPFIIEWIPDILPKSRIGELRIKLEYGHQRNGQIEHRVWAPAAQEIPIQTIHVQEIG